METKNPAMKSHSRRHTVDPESMIPDFQWTTVLGDFIQLSIDCRLHHKDVETIRRRASGEGMAFFTLRLPELAKAFLEGVRTGSFSAPVTFNRHGRSALPAFLFEQFNQVFESDGLIRTDPSPEATRTILQICTLYKKCDLPYDESQNASVADGFINVERELSSSYGSIFAKLGEDRKILQIASQLLGKVFKGFDLRELSYKDGPGVVSNHPEHKQRSWGLYGFFYRQYLLGFVIRVEKCHKQEKSLSALTSVYYFEAAFWYNYHDWFDSLGKHPVHDHFTLFSNQEHAEVLLVPKDTRGPRLISCEPRENQYCQQGLMKFMVEALESSPLTRGLVNFTFQEINQQLALAASNGEPDMATLDLKDASDRISWELVCELFAEAPTLLDSLRHARSAYTLMPCKYTSADLSEHYNVLMNSHGEFCYKVPLYKHAPMGSSVCFPVMASCIWALLTSALIVVYGEWAYTSGMIKSVFVYGDDIIVPSTLAEFCIDVLERFGLKVNRDKSFWTGPFRESCGLDAFLGTVVTSVKVRTLYPNLWNQENQTKNQAAKEILSLWASANLASSAGYASLAERLYKRVERGLGSSLPYGPPGSPYLCRVVPLEVYTSMGQTEKLNNAPVKQSTWRTIEGSSPNWAVIRHRGKLRMRVWTVKSILQPMYETFYGFMLRRETTCQVPLYDVPGGHGNPVMENPSLLFGYGSTRNSYELRREWVEVN